MALPLIISSIFNKAARLPIINYLGVIVPGKFENGSTSCYHIDILLEGHHSVESLSNTKTFGSLFKTGQISFQDINALSDVVRSQYERPSDPLLTTSVKSTFDPSTKVTKETTLNVDKDTVFTLMSPDKPIRHSKAIKTDKREISFISLSVPSNREKASLVFD